MRIFNSRWRKDTWGKLSPHAKASISLLIIVIVGAVWILSISYIGPGMAVIPFAVFGLGMIWWCLLDAFGD